MTAVYRDKHRCWHAAVLCCAVLAQRRGQVCGPGGAGQSGEVRQLQPAQLLGGAPLTMAQDMHAFFTVLEARAV